MHLLAKLLMGLGLTLGAVVGLGMLLGVTLPGIPWLVAVGTVKLTLAGSVGLIGAGAVLRRLAIRAERREQMLLADGSELGS